jgi:hypothetical protein
MKYRIQADTLDSEQLELEARGLLKKLKSDPELRNEAAARGIDLAVFDRQVVPQLDEPLITVEAESAGIDPGLVQIIIVFATPLAPVLAGIVQDCWTQLILPHLKKKYGVDAIEEAPKSAD